MDGPRYQAVSRGRARSFEMGSGLGIDITSANSGTHESDAAGTSPAMPSPIDEAGEEPTTNPANSELSPPSTGGLSGTTRFGASPNDFSPANPKDSPAYPSPFTPSTPHAPVRVDSEISLLPKYHRASFHSAYEDFTAKHKCESVKTVKGRQNWLSILTILLSAYSTAFSIIFAVLAANRQEYGFIGAGEPLTPSSANIITTVIAKTIELSFVTVVIAMLGQELSRKAFGSGRTGVTLAELNMRGWIMQPGTMLSRWESVRYAAMTRLGVISVVAALLALLYTSAATSLVQPQLRTMPDIHRNMTGRVHTSFANVNYLAEQCYTPIPTDFDPVDGKATCLSVEHAAAAYKNYFTYLEMWRNADPEIRPSGFALFSNDTRVNASWVGKEVGNFAAYTHDATGAVINNVSLAFPHAGVVDAATIKSNAITQPKDLNERGEYTVDARVASPVLRSLCATVSEEHLAPLVFDRWNATDEPLDHKTWPEQLRFTASHPSPYLNGTALDGIFEWGEQYGEYAWPPVFMKLPQDNNTIVNGTGIGTQRYGRSSVYILGKSSATEPDSVFGGQDYFLCQLQVSQSASCYTKYRASGQGADLEAVCGDNSADETWIPEVADDRGPADRDWPNVASDMLRAVALNDGLYDGKSTNARLLSQLMLRNPKLDPAQPSLAEALAVLAGSTLLQSTVGSPFTSQWEYAADMSTDGIINDPSGAVAHFVATISAQQYASGGVQPYEQAFHVVLWGVVLLNVIVLVYFFVHIKTWYMDFSEPPNLFSLAVNSPPSEAFAGCCGTGPQGKDYRVAWTVEEEGGHVFVHSGGRLQTGQSLGVKKRKPWRSAMKSSTFRKFGK